MLSTPISPFISEVKRNMKHWSHIATGGLEFVSLMSPTAFFSVLISILWIPYNYLLFFGFDMCHCHPLSMERDHTIFRDGST